MAHHEHQDVGSNENSHLKLTVLVRKVDIFILPFNFCVISNMLVEIYTLPFAKAL